MPAAWEQRFDFYFGTESGIPVVTSLDLAAIDHAPVPGYSHVVTVVVRMKHPREDGLRSQEESENLFALEDALIADLEDRMQAIYCGRRVTAGRTEFSFYAPSAPGAALVERLKGTVLSGYEFDVRSGEDPDWRAYRDSFPGSFHRQTMWNRQVQTQLVELGDDLTAKRRIDHRALFPVGENVRAAAARLKRSGFRVGRPHGPDESGWVALDFSRRDACDDGVPDETTIEILDCIEPSGGVYDGWGCEVRR